MRLAILDDWFDTLRGLPCFSKLDGIDVTVFSDHEPDVDALAERLAPFRTRDEVNACIDAIYDWLHTHQRHINACLRAAADHSEFEAAEVREILWLRLKTMAETFVTALRVAKGDVEA